MTSVRSHRLIFSALMVLMLRRINKQNIEPKPTIGKYALIKKIKTRNTAKNFATAQYAYRNKTVFIKTWDKKVKDLSYFTLLNEYRLAKVLYKKMNRGRRLASSIEVPKPISLTFHGTSVSAVYEYVEGQRLSSYSKRFQLRVMNMILKDLLFVSMNLTSREKERFGKRGLSFYLFSTLIYALMRIFTQPSKAHIIVHAASDCLVTLFQMRNNTLVVAHRDLQPENVLVAKGRVYLVDLEDMMLTLPQFDHAMMLIFRYVRFAKKRKYHKAQYSANYLSLQRANSLSYQPNEYARYLINAYEKK